MSVKKEKFFEVKKEEAPKKKFSLLNVLRKFSEPIVIPKSIPESNFEDTGPQIRKKFSLQNIARDGFAERKPSSLVPQKDDDLFSDNSPNFNPSIKRKGSLSSLLSPKAKEIPIFTSRKMSSPVGPQVKDFNSPRNLERPHFNNEKHKNMNIASTLPVLDYEKTKKLEENYRKLGFEEIVKEEKQRFQQKNEFSPMLILRCFSSQEILKENGNLDDNEWENAVKVVHVEEV